MRHLSIVAAVAALLSSALHATPRQTLAGAQLLPLAKISPPAAKACALKARPGTIVNQELEKEKGGSGLRYSFDIRARGTIYEVGVDAKSGRILENLVEGPHLD